MKALLAGIAAVIFLNQTAYCQPTEIEKQIRDEIWTRCPKEFKAMDVPDKWKNESAVILAFNKQYIGDLTTKVTGIANVTRFYIEKLNYHYRIKLLDKAAVAEFSDISFNSKTIKSNLFGKASAYRVIGIKVIKPDGTEKEVDLSKAVKADATSDSELKIPIPNLETGDIIDYFLALRDETTSMPDFGDEYVLEMKYPVVSNTLSFSLPHQYVLHAYPYNGAPSFTSEKKDKDVVYTLRDEMRDKTPEMIWHAPLLSAPHFRYRITGNDFKPDVRAEAKEILAGIGYNPSDIGILDDYMKINFKDKKDLHGTIKEIYFLLRNPLYMKALYDIQLGDPLGGPQSPNRFFLLFDKYLQKYKISHELVFSPARQYAPWENLINMGSCDLFIRINTTPEFYISRPTPFSLPNEIPYEYEGTEGVAADLKAVPLLVSDKNQNSTVASFEVALNPEDPAQLKIKRTIVAKGHNKPPHQYLIFTNYDYMKAYDLPKYQAQSSGLMRGILKEFNKEKAKFEQRLTQDYHARDERIKQELEEELGAKVISYENLQIKAIGMWDTAPDTEYSDEYMVENLSKKVGPNIMIDVGKLIESQTKIKDTQRSRSRDIFMPYARSFTNQISFTIPPGYKVEGLENLNMNITNETGGFTATAALTGNLVSIRAYKYYEKSTYEASAWPKMLPFLDAANNFYQIKILLKKI